MRIFTVCKVWLFFFTYNLIIFESYWVIFLEVFTLISSYLSKRLFISNFILKNFIYFGFNQLSLYITTFYHMPYLRGVLFYFVKVWINFRFSNCWWFLTVIVTLVKTVTHDVNIFMVTLAETPSHNVGIFIVQALQFIWTYKFMVWWV